LLLRFELLSLQHGFSLKLQGEQLLLVYSLSEEVATIV
jgi:hypothetical protein